MSNTVDQEEGAGAEAQGPGLTPGSPSGVGFFSARAVISETHSLHTCTPRGLSTPRSRTPEILEAENLGAQRGAFGRLVAGTSGVLWGPPTLSREAGVSREQLNTSEHFGEVTTPPGDAVPSPDELPPHRLEWRARAPGVRSWDEQN